MYQVTSAPSAIATTGLDPDDRSAPFHLSEVVRHLPREHLRGLLADIIRYERDGSVSEAIEDTLRRASCHADATRIFARPEAA